MNKKIFRIKNLKSKRKIVCLTAYSKPISKILDKHCDLILVGDSVATAFYGMKSTKYICVWRVFKKMLLFRERYA